jgi:hypothetical protein
MFTTLLPGSRLPTAPCARPAHRKYSFPSIVACIRVYRAVAWQRVDQIRYIIFELRLDLGVDFYIHVGGRFL